MKPAGNNFMLEPESRYAANKFNSTSSTFNNNKFSLPVTSRGAPNNPEGGILMNKYLKEKSHPDVSSKVKQNERWSIGVPHNFHYRQSI